MVIRGDHSVIPPISGSSDPACTSRTEGRRRAENEDVVEISDEAKQMNTGGSERLRQSQNARPMETGASRIRADISERIQNGFYDSEEVVNRVARKLLDLFGF